MGSRKFSSGEPEPSCLHVAADVYVRRAPIECFLQEWVADPWMNRSQSVTF